MRPELCLYHVHGPNIGYGRLGVELAAALSKLGIEVYDDQPTPPETRRPHEVKAHVNQAPGPTNVVAWVSTPSHAHGWFKGQYPVIFTMWEAQRLPESFRETLPEFECVVVPSHQNVELLSRYHDNVHFAPLGVNPDIWHYEHREPPQSEFRFLCSGSGSRKGTDLTYRAFQKVFGKEGSWGSGPVPYLIMKSPKGGEFRGPRIEVVTGRLSQEAEVDIYASAHCYVGPSRGEGFGLMPLQALAQGTPTILTAAHGHDSYAHLGYGLSSVPAKSAYFIFGDAGDWWEPSFDELCEYLKWVYENYEQALDQGKSAAAVVANEFTWADTAARFIDAVGADRLATPYSGEGGWHEPVRLRYEVRVNRPWKAEIAGRCFVFKPGESYMELADVKRILWESGILDPICIAGDDTGLAPEQVAKLGKSSASERWCPTCGQGLNTRQTHADALYDEYSNNTSSTGRD